MSIQPCVFIVDDDYAVRDSLELVFEAAGLDYKAFENAEQFLQVYCPGTLGCLVLDVNMPSMNGDELQAELIRRNIHLPIIFLTAYADISMTVRTIKAGAIDFLTKPVSSKLLVERIEAVLQNEMQMHEQTIADQERCNRLNNLTPHELDILPLVLAGRSNKEIARHLGISHRTVEAHRIHILTKSGATNLLELVRLCDTCKIPPG